MYMYMSSSIPVFCADFLQVKRFLEHVNCHLPNLSRNLFILFNHWDQVAGGDEEIDSDDDDDDDDTKENPERVKEQHLERVHRFVEQGLKAKSVVDRTFFVSGREACKVQKDKEKGKQSSTGRSVVYMQSLYFSMVMSSPRLTALGQHHHHFCMLNIVLLFTLFIWTLDEPNCA